MKAQVLQSNLHKALSFVGKSVSTKTQLPVLSNILLETDQGRLKLSSTNLETSISFWVGAQIGEEGALTVPARLFSELVGSFRQEKVSLTATATALKMTCGDSEATLTGIAASEFPPLPTIGPQKDAVLQRSILEKGLPFVLIAASTDEGRPILTGIKFMEKEDQLWLVATDGYRLSLRKLPKTKGLGDGFAIPARALSEVFRLLTEEKNDAVDLYFSKDQNQMIFALENAQITTRLIEGEYPPFERIIPAGFTTRVIFDKIGLQRAVKFASVYAKESANILKISVTRDKVIISANSPQVGDNKTIVDAQVEGEGGEVAFNAKFVSDLLAVFPEDQVAFEMTGPLAPGVFKLVDDPSYLHIIMPVRVQG
jgi:DNA polymerase-3 subunit beta